MCLESRKKMNLLQRLVLYEHKGKFYSSNQRPNLPLQAKDGETRLNGWIEQHGGAGGHLLVMVSAMVAKDVKA